MCAEKKEREFWVKVNPKQQHCLDGLPCANTWGTSRIRLARVTLGGDTHVKRNTLLFSLKEEIIKRGKESKSVRHLNQLTSPRCRWLSCSGASDNISEKLNKRHFSLKPAIFQLDYCCKHHSRTQHYETSYPTFLILLFKSLRALPREDC